MQYSYNKTISTIIIDKLELLIAMVSEMIIKLHNYFQNSIL